MSRQMVFYNRKEYASQASPNYLPSWIVRAHQPAPIDILGIESCHGIFSTNIHHFIIELLCIEIFPRIKRHKKKRDGEKENWN